MDITWLGHAATRIRTRAAAVVMDPYDRSIGGTMGRPDAHIITISHQDPMRNGVAGVAPTDGAPMVLDGPGEYEIRGVLIEAVRASLRPVEGASPESLRSVLWHFEAEDLRVAHLGGLGTQPTAAQLDLLSNVDIVIVPIGLADTLGPVEAAKAIRALEPTITIPVGYDPAGDGADLKAFADALALKPEEPVLRFTIARRSASEERRLVILEARA
ncbi:MAG: Zn-dependent hydrolase [Dehalococcoidia bacterium]|nr:Zn-dependent hydrolase [Dehalococcoidia bacterium]